MEECPKELEASALDPLPTRPKGAMRLIGNLYAQFVIAGTGVLLLTEVLPNSIPLFFFHGYLFTFLLTTAVLCIACVYMSCIIQKCPGMEEIESENQEIGRSEINALFRAGTLVFGSGTLVTIALEITTSYSLEKRCMDQLNLVQPILHAVFTLMQMHFLCLQSQGPVQYLGWCRNLVLMHLMATNICVWLRFIIWETSESWIKASDKCSWPENELVQLRQCYKNSPIGIIWSKAQPFLVPFLVQFCLVGSVITYHLWSEPTSKERREYTRTNCKGSSNGFFLGLLVLAVGIVILILFFVLSTNENLKDETLVLILAAHCGILGLSVLGILLGLCKVNGTCSVDDREQTRLQHFGVFAVYAQGVCSMVVGFTHFADDARYLITFVDGVLVIFQCVMQSLLFHQIGQKGCSSESCKHARPGRQVIAFLAFANLVLWMTESFTTQHSVSGQLQIELFGVIAWGLVSRVLLPVVMFYRFYSCVFLLENWKSAYSKKG